MIAAALALSLGALPLLAQGPGQRTGGPGRGGPGGARAGLRGSSRCCTSSDLTDAQREQLRGLMEDGPARRAIPAPRCATRSRSCTPRSWPTRRICRRSTRLKAALNTAHAAELDHRIEMMQKVAQILTPAQRQQLLKLQAAGAAAGARPGAAQLNLTAM